MSRQAVSAVESGLSDPSLRVALALARALGMTVEDMFGPAVPALQVVARPVAPLGRKDARVTPGEAGTSRPREECTMLIESSTVTNCSPAARTSRSVRPRHGRISASRLWCRCERFSLPPLPGCGHSQPGRSQAGPGLDSTVRQATQWRGTRIIRSRTARDIATLDYCGQQARPSDDQRGMYMFIMENRRTSPTVAAKGSRFGWPAMASATTRPSRRASGPVIRDPVLERG